MKRSIHTKPYIGAASLHKNCESKIIFWQNKLLNSNYFSVQTRFFCLQINFKPEKNRIKNKSGYEIVLGLKVFGSKHFLEEFGSISFLAIKDDSEQKPIIHPPDILWYPTEPVKHPTDILLILTPCIWSPFDQ